MRSARTVEGPTRTAYALESEKLPDPQEGRLWRPVENFNAGDEIPQNSQLKEVFKAAIRDGYAIVTQSFEMRE